MTIESKATQMRRLLAQDGSLVLPGCYDALSAKLLERAGFPAAYMSGSAVTASLIGMPDVGLLSVTEMVDQARRIADGLSIPLICDADTGYGNALNVRRAIQLYERAGVAGVHIEDQVFPKRCGHFSGKDVISAAEMVTKVRAAVEARENPDFIIIARTDARAVHGLDDAIERAHRYAGAGADVIFVEAPATEDELRRVAGELPYPLLVNIVEGGKTPQLSFEELQSMGFKIILYPTAAIRAVMKTLGDLYTAIQRDRGTQQVLDRLVSFNGRNDITGLAAIEDLERRYAVPVEE